MGRKIELWIRIMLWRNLHLQKGWRYLTVKLFLARYKRVKRSDLPPSMIMRRNYTQWVAPRGWKRRRGAQQGQGIFDFVKKIAKNPIVRLVAKKGLECAPDLYHNLTKRVKNKTLKRILNSDTTHLALNKAIKTADRCLWNV